VPFGFEISLSDCGKAAAVIHLYYEDLAAPCGFLSIAVLVNIATALTYSRSKKYFPVDDF
jgi:hypothetical protein